MSLEESLSAVEQLIEKVSAALLAADPQDLEQSSTALRDAAARLTYALEQSAQRGQPLPAPLKKRVEDIGAQLANLREGLARLSANADRQVAGLQRGLRKAARRRLRDTRVTSVVGGRAGQAAGHVCRAQGQANA